MSWGQLSNGSQPELVPHAGQGQRRNPYDGIVTSEGLTLRQIASKLPSLPDTYVSTSLSKVGRRAGFLPSFSNELSETLGNLSERCETGSSACSVLNNRETSFSLLNRNYN